MLAGSGGGVGGAAVVLAAGGRELFAVWERLVLLLKTDHVRRARRGWRWFGGLRGGCGGTACKCWRAAGGVEVQQSAETCCEARVCAAGERGWGSGGVLVGLVVLAL